MYSFLIIVVITKMNDPTQKNVQICIGAGESGDYCHCTNVGKAMTAQPRGGSHEVQNCPSQI